MDPRVKADETAMPATVSQGQPSTIAIDDRTAGGELNPPRSRQLDSRAARRARLQQALALLWPSRAAALVCALVCVAVPVSLVVIHVERSPSFSPQDEVESFDYVQRVSELTLPRLGQQLLPSTNAQLRCVGRQPIIFSKQLFSTTVPPCRGATAAQINRFYHSPADAQYEVQQPPLYYALTALARWPLMSLAGLSPLPATRLVGALWLAATLLMLWIAARLIGIDWRVTAAGALLLAAAPTVVLSASMVNNDIAALFAGGVVAVSAAVAWRLPDRLPWWGFAGVGVLAVALKETGALPVLTVSGLLCADACARARSTASGTRELLRSGPFRSWLRSGGAMLLGAGGVLIVWSIAFHALALMNPTSFAAVRINTDGHSGVADLAGNALAMLQPLTNTPMWPYRWSGSGPITVGFWTFRSTQLTSQLLASLPLIVAASWIFSRRRTWCQWLAAASMLVLFLGGWALGISIMLTYHYNTRLPGRYGLSMAVLLVLAVIGVLEGRLSRLLFSGFALALYALALSYILT